MLINWSSAVVYRPNTNWSFVDCYWEILEGRVPAIKNDHNTSIANLTLDNCWYRGYPCRRYYAGFIYNVHGFSMTGCVLHTLSTSCATAGSIAIAIRGTQGGKSVIISGNNINSFEEGVSISIVSEVLIIERSDFSGCTFQFLGLTTPLDFILSGTFQRLQTFQLQFLDQQLEICSHRGNLIGTNQTAAS